MSQTKELVRSYSNLQTPSRLQRRFNPQSTLQGQEWTLIASTTSPPTMSMNSTCKWLRSKSAPGAVSSRNAIYTSSVRAWRAPRISGCPLRPGSFRGRAPKARCGQRTPAARRGRRCKEARGTETATGPRRRFEQSQCSTSNERSWGRYAHCGVWEDRVQH